MAIHRENQALDDLLQDADCAGMTLEICSKESSLGPRELTQFWLQRSSVYGGRGRHATNQSAILTYFHRKAAACGDPAIIRNAAETHLIASLTPEIRSNGAQRVLPDAPARSDAKSSLRFRAVDELNKQLGQLNHQELTAFEFYEKSRGITDFPDLESDVVCRYEALQAELLDGAVRKWAANPGRSQAIVLERWRNWQRLYGRRSRNAVTKSVLDILSYESKAALHQCYSLLWQALAVAFARETSCEFVKKFHEFWHCDLRLPTEDVQDMHLMHGHVFALHPAFSRMIQTAVGSQIIGEAIGTAVDSPSMQRFFAAGLLSLDAYMSDRLERRSRTHLLQLPTAGL